MAKLRKMMGDVSSPECKAMMQLIETQSVSTLSRWAVGYVKAYLLDYYMESEEADPRLGEIVDLCENAIVENRKVKEIKPQLKEAVQIARETGDPAAEAAARAISTACGVMQTPTNALGFLFYACAASVYHQSLTLPQQEAEKIIQAEWERAFDTLSALAVENEPNPAKIKWGC